MMGRGGSGRIRAGVDFLVDVGQIRAERDRPGQEKIFGKRAKQIKRRNDHLPPASFLGEPEQI